MRLKSRQPLRSEAVLTLLGTFLILTVFAASDARAAGTWSLTGNPTVSRFFSTGATLLTDRAGAHHRWLRGTRQLSYAPCQRRTLQPGHWYLVGDWEHERCPLLSQVGATAGWTGAGRG